MDIQDIRFRHRGSEEMIQTRHGLAQLVLVATDENGQKEILLEIIEEYIN